jgi:hypothetical protein
VDGKGVLQGGLGHEQVAVRIIAEDIQHFPLLPVPSPDDSPCRTFKNMMDGTEEMVAALKRPHPPIRAQILLRTLRKSFWLRL